MQCRVLLTADREAHVAMILEEHAALIRRADAKRDERLAPLFRVLGIDPTIQVNIERVDEGAEFVYNMPDIAPVHSLPVEGEPVVAAGPGTL